MAEKVELNGFLNELILMLKKKFQVYDGNIKSMREDIKRLSAEKDDSKINDINNRLRILENSIEAMKARTQVDSSMLKDLESEQR